MVHLMSQKMGIHEWSFDNAVSVDKRVKVPLRDVSAALKNIRVEVELGFNPQLALKEAQRCLNCDVPTACASSAMPASIFARWIRSASSTTVMKTRCANA
jgi:hypothetical protein